jgi:DNA-binding Xre family transcriptional regulator
MSVKNRVKEFVDSKGITVYQFRKETGIANKTAYDLYNHPGQYPGKNVMEAICRVYNLQPGDLLEYLPCEKVQAP